MLKTFVTLTTGRTVIVPVRLISVVPFAAAEQNIYNMLDLLPSRLQKIKRCVCNFANIRIYDEGICVNGMYQSCFLS